MDNFTKKDYTILTGLLGLDQDELRKLLLTFLKSKYDKVIEKDYFIAAEGTIPIVLIAHMDTVFHYGPRGNGLLYDREKNIMINPFIGAGFDDRAGIFAIIKLINKGYLPHIIFTMNEETSGNGAQEAARYPNLFEKVKYVIELDRQGEKDCVFYRCGNSDFEDYIMSFGFELDWGTFTDISIICPSWGIAGVNVSVGYINEHSLGECLNINWLLATIDRIEQMLLKEKDALYFGYIPSILDKFCSKCHSPFLSNELTSIVDRNGKIITLCPNCLSNDIQWCEYCHSLYIPNKNEDIHMCYNCKKESKK